MASPEYCFVSPSNGMMACNCTSPPPKLPPRPTFCEAANTTTPAYATNPTTTALPTTQTTTNSTTLSTTDMPTMMTTNPTTTQELSDCYTPPCPTGATTTFETVTDTQPLTTTGPATGTTPLATDEDTTVISTALIAGCTVGAVAAILLLVLLLWWLWKSGKMCFHGNSGPNGSEALVAGNGKEVELLYVKKGTVTLTPSKSPTPPPPAWPDPEGTLVDTAPVSNMGSDLTPVEQSKSTSPSRNAESKTESTRPTSSETKKKGRRSNRVSPEP